MTITADQQMTEIAEETTAPTPLQAALSRLRNGLWWATDIAAAFLMPWRAARRIRTQEDSIDHLLGLLDGEKRKLHLMIRVAGDLANERNELAAAK